MQPPLDDLAAWLDPPLFGGLAFAHAAFPAGPLLRPRRKGVPPCAPSR